MAPHLFSATDVWIGLGSNVGDRARSLKLAYSLVVETPGLEVVKPSHLYESEPWGYTDQPAFLNAVVHVQTALGPLQVLLRLQSIEREVGRTPTFRWGPREIDLDLLRYGDAVLRRRGLVLPHPALAERAFVLVPLREVSPDFRDDSGRTVDEMIALLRLGGTEIRRLEGVAGLLE